MPGVPAKIARELHAHLRMQRSSGSASWSAPIVPSRLVTVMPTSVIPRRSTSGIAASSRSRAAAAIASASPVVRRACATASRACSRRSAGAGRRCARRGPCAASGFVTARPGRRAPRRGRRACAGAGRARAARRTTAARAGAARGGTRGCARSRGRSGPRPCRATAMSSASLERRGLADRAAARARAAARRRRADAPDALDRQRVQELELALGRHDEQPVGLRGAARDLREHLRPRDADAQRQPDLLAHLAAQLGGDLGRAARRARDVEERLLERAGLDDGVRGRKIAKTALLAPCTPPRTSRRRAASGHRRRAAPSLIPPRTPNARAS